jgi:hypothetical protein
LQIWVGTEQLDEESQMHVARHTLCGEVALTTPESQIDTKFHVFVEIGMFCFMCN